MKFTEGEPSRICNLGGGKQVCVANHDIYILSMEWYFQQQRETHLLTGAKEKNDDAEARHELPLDTRRMKLGVQGVIGGQA